MSLRMLIVGAGAVGGYFGGRLLEAGREVTFLVRPARAEQLRREGLRIVSPHGDLKLTPKLVTADALATPYDLVLLSVKAYALDSALADMAPAVGPKTQILPVLNGMRHIELLQQRFGSSAVLGGVCLVATELDETGRIVQMADFQQLVYGELDGDVSQRSRALDAALQGAGFHARLSTNVLQEMWEKWVMLASLGAVTCLLRGSVGEVVEVPGGSETALAVLEECTRVATACGHAPSESFLARPASVLTAPGSSLTSSMYRDLRRGAPVEADQILGDLIARAVSRGVATPLLKAAFVSLRVYQAARLSRTAPPSVR
jgi:2-dehydropantoate 2-reductase